MRFAARLCTSVRRTSFSIASTISSLSFVFHSSWYTFRCSSRCLGPDRHCGKAGEPPFAALSTAASAPAGPYDGAACARGRAWRGRGRRRGRGRGRRACASAEEYPSTPSAADQQRPRSRPTLEEGEREIKEVADAARDEAAAAFSSSFPFVREAVAASAGATPAVATAVETAVVGAAMANNTSAS